MTNTLVGRPMEILLVEDNLIDARLTIESLKKGRIKHRLTFMRDGEEAMEFLHREGRFARAPRPDLILLDLNLPKKDGREVLSEVRADDDLRQIPIVILTISTADEDRLRAEHLQVEGYMNKPINFDQFVDLIEQLKRYWHEDVILPTRK